MNSLVDQYFKNQVKWNPEFRALRSILLDFDLTETLKWKVPCYTFNDKNIVILGGFKSFCTLSFFKGTLIKDNHSLLEKPGENSQAIRIMKFKNIQEIKDIEHLIPSYIKEAISIEKKGLIVDSKSINEHPIIIELQEILDNNPAFKKAFEGLTPGRQRGYHIYFSGAKQSKTRKSRIEKYTPRILKGIGYYDCTCGLSKKMPTCDGSHKVLFTT